jgi:hypothetical protein
MQTNESQDAWVLARVAALERTNRLLWVGFALTFTTLASLAIAGAMFAAHLELPAGMASALGGGGTVSVDELQVHKAVRVVDDTGRNLVWIGREPDRASGGSDGQAVIGLFATGSGGEPQQTMRLATSPLGSAVSLSSLDGDTTSSLFAGASGVSLELRRGGTARTFSEQREGAVAAAAAPPAAPRELTTARSQGDALAARPAGDGAASVDLTNPVLQAIGSGFLVSPTSVTDSSGGLRVRGRIVNATSLDQARAEFRLGVGKSEVPFTVARIDAGTSAQFVVELPQSASADVKAARMRWTRSNVSYGEE